MGLVGETLQRLAGPERMNRRSGLSIVLLTVSIAVGALREFLFVNLNYQLDFLSNRREQSYAHSSFQRWAQRFDVADLAAAKWLLAFGFIAITLALTLALARIRLGSGRLNKAIIIAFLIIGGLALVFHLASGTVVFLYPISVQLLHALQYPVLLIVVWAITWRKGS